MQILILTSQIAGRVRKITATSGEDDSKSGFSTASLDLRVFMKLITNTKHESHASVLCKLIRESASCFLCTSFLSADGLKIILPPLLDSIANNQLAVRIISNGELKYTPPAITRRLSKIIGIEHSVFNVAKRRLHTKLYYFEGPTCYKCLIGSANLTRNGLLKNEELSVMYEGEIGSAGHGSIVSYTNSLFRQIGLKV